MRLIKKPLLVSKGRVSSGKGSQLVAKHKMRSEVGMCTIIGPV